ncbi:hypothetical protein B0H17DRAFT_553322 [Mycena rosella]|uniref:Uncharacterized protein n=1 Tax=Mycena rosella TaxID=1033263 RepID=A0AAD7DH83_MYCRO|nr:hypothetical protein B0H17DRAFT_553322 [Mycena rosella]
MRPGHPRRVSPPYGLFSRNIRHPSSRHPSSRHPSSQHPSNRHPSSRRRCHRSLNVSPKFWTVSQLTLRGCSRHMSLTPYVALNTGAWWTMAILLMGGFAMTLVGYVGCFAIVQGSTIQSDTYIWLGTETALALIRLIIWAVNPAGDDPEGACLTLDCSNAVPLEVTLDTHEEPESQNTFKIVPERTFWEGLTAHSGPVDIDGMEMVVGFCHWYSWIKQGTAQILCLVLEGEQQTLLCISTMDGDRPPDMEFFQADLASKQGYAVQGEPFPAPRDFKDKVFEHCMFILLAKAATHPLPIRVSWPLSESWVVPPKAVKHPTSGEPKCIEQGLGTLLRKLGVGTEENKAKLPEELQPFVQRILGGEPLTFENFINCRRFISQKSTSRELHRQLADALHEHTMEVFTDLDTLPDAHLVRAYNQRWQRYSDGIFSLHRLFKPLNSDLVKNEQDKEGKDAIDTVENLGFKNGKMMYSRSFLINLS